MTSIALGPDNNWDLRYYHLYAPWAYLHDRYLFDIGPAQEQGFFNPVADLLFYGLISSPLNGMPRLLAFIMGAVHGINAALILAIAITVLRPVERLERMTLRGAALLMGVTGAGFVSLLGTTTNDLINSIFMLGALLGLLQAAQNEARSVAGRGLSWRDLTWRDLAWRDLAWPGLLAGIGVGVKYTAAIFVPGLTLVAAVVALRRRSFGSLLAFGAAAVAGCLIVAGHHMLMLWQDFGNPVFPFLNQIFRSPYYEPAPLRDARFAAYSVGQLISYPLHWTRITTYVVAELPFRDWRGAIAEVTMAAGLMALAARRLRDRRPWAVACRETRGLGLVFIFVAVSYCVWALGFGIYRYGVGLELLTGVVTMGALIWIFQDRRLRIAAAIAVLAIALASTSYLDWGRGQFGDKYVDVQVPPLPADSIVLIATWDPAAYFIPFAQPRAQYIGIENNYLEVGQHNKLAMEVDRLMRTPGRPTYVLSVDRFDPAKLNDLLAHFGRRLSGVPCLPIHSNLEVQALSLCPVAAE